MKAFYALAAVAVILVLLLAPVALFPEAVLDVADDLRVQYLERPRLIADLEKSLELAKNGDMDQQYIVAMYHFYEGEGWRHEAYEEAFGPKDRQKGEKMMNDLAGAGHPEALYRVYRLTGEEEAWASALRAGSRWAVGELHMEFVKHPCDDSLYAYVDVVRSRLDDPAYPWQFPDWPEDQKRWHGEWKATLSKDIVLLDSIRAVRCVAD